LTFAFHEEAIGGADSSIAIVTVGRGVGLGMMIHGHPFRGVRGRGGEFGHITVDPDGPLCECGKRGCLEAIVSLPALLRDAGAVLGQPVNEHELRRFVDSGHDRLSLVLDRAAAIFGGALATLVNILNPDMVVLSGEGSWFVEQMLPTITRSLNVQVFDGLAGEFALRVDQRGDDFWAKGAAGMLLEETFRPQLERVRHNGMTLSASGKR
jgi:predicted NBD/HSP70 family sugar kinase